MRVEDRIKDISRRCGFSEKIVRRVLDAECESIVASLKKGENATLIGRCVVKPKLRTRLAIGGDLERYVKVTATAQSLELKLENVCEFEECSDEKDDDILFGDEVRVVQISSLT